MFKFQNWQPPKQCRNTERIERIKLCPNGKENILTEGKFLWRGCCCCWWWVFCQKRWLIVGLFQNCRQIWFSCFFFQLISLYSFRDTETDIWSFKTEEKVGILLVVGDDDFLCNGPVLHWLWECVADVNSSVGRQVCVICKCGKFSGKVLTDL